MLNKWNLRNFRVIDLKILFNDGFLMFRLVNTSMRIGKVRESFVSTVRLDKLDP